MSPERHLRALAPRTTREAFGQPVRMESGEPEGWARLTWPAAALCALALVWGVVRAIDAADPNAELRAAGCSYLGDADGGRGVWLCRDGYRVSDNRGDAL